MAAAYLEGPAIPALDSDLDLIVKERLALYAHIIDDPSVNMMYNKCGMLDLVHSKSELYACLMHAGTATFCGVDIEFLDKEAFPNE